MSEKQPLTPEERAQRSAWMKRAWADGRFANRRKGMPRRHWTPEQNRVFTALAGTMPIDEIADELERRFYIRRSTASLRIQAKRLGISLWQAGLSLREMERVFGVNHKHIRRFWVDPGHLPARRWDGRGPYDGWWFEQRDVERFVRECNWLFDIDRMQAGHPLRRAAELARRADPWLIGQEAVGQALGMAVVQVKKWRDRGLIPWRGRPTAGRGEMMCVRGRDVPAIREAIVQARARSRAANIARFAAMRRGQLGLSA